MILGAVLYAKHMPELVKFYQQLGFGLIEGDETYSTLVHEQSELTIIQAPEAIAKTIELEQPAALRTLTPIKLVFVVESIEQMAKRLTEHGGRLDRGQARWQFREYHVQDAVDPEGNILQLRQRRD